MCVCKRDRERERKPLHDQLEKVHFTWRWPETSSFTHCNSNSIAGDTTQRNKTHTDLSEHEEHREEEEQ